MCNSVSSSDHPNPAHSFGLRQFRFYKRARRRRYWSFPGAPVPPTAFSWSASPLSCVRIPNTPSDKGSPAAVSPSLRRSVFYPVASPVALFLAAAPRFFFDCARYATLMSPLSAPGCICMGGDSPCFSRGHCNVLINPPGRNLPCPRACGFLPLPLIGHGTCHLGT